MSIADDLKLLSNGGLIRQNDTEIETEQLRNRPTTPNSESL